MQSFSPQVTDVRRIIVFFLLNKVFSPFYHIFWAENDSDLICSYDNSCLSFKNFKSENKCFFELEIKSDLLIFTEDACNSYVILSELLQHLEHFYDRLRKVIISLEYD